MSLIDDITAIVTAMTESDGSDAAFDFFYGLDEWKLIDTESQTRRFMYLDPVEGSVPEKETGNFRETYSINILIAKCETNPDLSKEQERDAVWLLRPFALQFMRRMFAYTNANGAKKYIPYDGGGSIREVRKFLASNIYGVFLSFNIQERFPSESC